MIDRGTGTFRDPDHDNIDVRGFVPAANSEDACSSNAQAFGYPTKPGTKPGFVVVICQSAFDMSDMDHDKNLPVQVASWRTKGKLYLANNIMKPPKLGVDVLEKYLSIKIVHEMMHVGDCIKCKCLPMRNILYLILTALVPGQLPESTKREQYGYHQIMAKDGDNDVLSPKDKQSNADSYTLAAGGIYIYSLRYLTL